MSAPTASELRIPAHRDYVLVAKRAAAAFGVVAGFDVEAIEDLVIAVAQACENAISAAERGSGPQGGQVRIGFRLEDQRLEVQVRSMCGRGEGLSECGPAAETVAREHMLATADEARRRAEAAANDLALRMMGLFVDDCRYRVDERTGGLRVRLTKYRIS